MKNLKSSQRSYLKSHAHHLEPVIHIGKSGLTEGIIHSINIALLAKELIKIKFREFKDDKQKIADVKLGKNYIIGGLENALKML